MTEADEVLLRQLGAHERYTLIRSNLGYSPVICLAAQGRGDSDYIALLTTSIRRKVQLLLNSETLLSCHIHGARTTAPRYARRKREIKVDDYFKVESVLKLLDPGELLRTNLLQGRNDFNVSSTPLWKVTLQIEEGGSFVVILLTHHIIIDGKGAANIMELLLSASDQLPSIDQAADGLIPLEEIPLKSDASVEGFQLGFLRKRFVDLALALPSAISNYLRAPSNPPWPYKEDILIHPTKATIERHSVVTIKVDQFVLDLKKQAQAHGVKTINPLLDTAAKIALYSIVGENVHFRSDIPINERATGLKHTLYTGNYVSVNVQSGVMKGSSDVWKETRSFADQVRQGRMKARTVFGELGYALERFNKDTSHVPTGECPTLADAFFYRTLHSERPYASSFSMSNLGAMQDLSSKIEAVYWSQTVHPNMAPIKVEVCGFGMGKTGPSDVKIDESIGSEPAENAATSKESNGAGGLSLTVGTREGVIGKDREDRFKDVLIKALHLMRDGLEEGVTFDDVLNRIDK